VSLTEKIAISIGGYTAVMVAIAWKFRLREAFNRARNDTGDPTYD